MPYKIFAYGELHCRQFKLCHSRIGEETVLKVYSNVFCKQEMSYGMNSWIKNAFLLNATEKFSLLPRVTVVFSDLFKKCWDFLVAIFVHKKHYVRHPKNRFVINPRSSIFKLPALKLTGSK